MNAHARDGTHNDANALYAVVASCLGVPRGRVTAETSLIEDLGLDSIDRLALAVDFEEKFDVVIPDVALCRIHTIGDAILYLARA